MIVMVDTSVWINHFRNGNDQLKVLLEDGRVLTHPLVIGELACGNLKNRTEILELLGGLPKFVEADHSEAMELLTTQHSKAPLYGKGLGWVDVQLMAATLLSEAKIFSLDRALMRIARDFSAHF